MIDLRRRVAIAGLWSHEETGNGWTYQRDLAVGAWCLQHGIVWIQVVCISCRLGRETDTKTRLWYSRF